jgi:DNA polymerase-4
MAGAALCRDCGAEPAEGARRCPACASPRLLRHPELHRLTIAHVDCDAFYASVEKRDRPELREQPVIVGGGVRGVVTTACYLARVYGVRSAMPMFKALKLCPHAAVVRPDFTKYVAESRRIFGRLAQLTPLMQPLSIDEAWLDLAGSERLHGGSPAQTLARAQREIEAETGLTVSVGLARNKFLAKIASDLDKPRGFSVIGSEAAEFLSDRPAAILPSVGPQFARTLERAGFTTVGSLARAEPKDLVRRFGAYGLRLHELAHGRDARAVDPASERKGTSAETTFNTDLSDPAALEDKLQPLCEKVAARLRERGWATRIVVLKLKTADFRLLTRRRTLPVPTQTARTLFACARDLLRAELDGTAYRLIGVGAAELLEASAGFDDFFAEAEARALKAEVAVDALRSKFGQGAVRTGRALRSSEG